MQKTSIGLTIGRPRTNHGHISINPRSRRINSHVSATATITPQTKKKKKKTIQALQIEAKEAAAAIAAMAIASTTPVSISTVDCLLQEVRKALYRRFSTVNSNIKATNPDENFCLQAFQYFTNTNTITPEAFHHKVAKLGLVTTRLLCNQLFSMLDQEGMGELTYTLFKRRVFISNESGPVRPTSARSSTNSSTSSTLKSIPTPHRPKSAQTLTSSRPEQEEEERGKLSVAQVLSLVQTKLNQQNPNEMDPVRQAYQLFHKSTGISRFDLEVAMDQLGLSLSPTLVQELFLYLDREVRGELDLSTFLQGFPNVRDTTSHTTWYRAPDLQQIEQGRKLRMGLALESVRNTWTLEEIEQRLREKIEQRTSRSSDCFRQAFRIFKKVNGIRPHEFHSALESIGLALDRAQSDLLFQRFDRNGSGDIDLDEFIHGVLAPDYTGRQWVAAADEMHREAAQRQKEAALLDPNRYMTEIEMEHWSLDEIEKRIRDKIQQSTSRSSDTFRQAYKIFKKSNHVTLPEFRERLLALGFRLTPAQATGLFQRYDSDNSNDLDLQEFCMRILPPDYNGEGDYWSHTDKYHQHKAKQQLEFVKQSQNGLVQLPAWEESRVRYARGQNEKKSTPTTPVRTPSRPETPCRPTSPPNNPSRPSSLRPSTPTGMSPRRSTLSTPLRTEIDEEYEDDEVIGEEDDPSMHFERKPKRESGFHRTSTCSVAGESTTSFSSTTNRVAGPAKYTPTRNKVLLVQKLLKKSHHSRPGRRVVR